MIYFFKILANNDGFGQATIKKFYENGIRQVSDIYLLDADQLIEMGFGEKTSKNLIDQLNRSRQESIEDWRFLAAFGVQRLGMGNCENLLKNYPITEIFDLTAEDIADIDGFAELTAEQIFVGLKSIHVQYQVLIEDGFEIERTSLMKDENFIDNPFKNKKIVFTGAMSHPRSELEKQAKTLGISVAKSVSSKTDFLIIGEKVGQSKMNHAKKHNIEIMTESEYLKKLNP